MKTNQILTAMAATLFVGFTAFTMNASAQNGNFDKTHPRRAEVNGRLNNQNARVDNKVANGKMSNGEAAKIHSQDHAIHREEKRDAATNHGHITKAEQTHINHQQNQVSKEIKNH